MVIQKLTSRKGELQGALSKAAGGYTRLEPSTSQSD